MTKASKEKQKKRSAEHYGKNKPRILAKMKKYHLDNREKRLEGQKKRYYDKHEEELARYKKYYESNRGKIINNRRKSIYGVAQGWFDKTFAEQGFVCSVCLSSDWGKNGPHIDHDHGTGVVRGILCHRCNVGMGLFKDNIDVMKRAIRYLERYK
jgi:hypothetical protein